MILLNRQAVERRVSGVRFIICLVAGNRREPILRTDADRKRLKLI